MSAALAFYGDRTDGASGYGDGRDRCHPLSRWLILQSSLGRVSRATTIPSMFLLCRPRPMGQAARPNQPVVDRLSHDANGG